MPTANDTNQNLTSRPLEQGRQDPRAEKPNQIPGLATKPTPGTTTSPWIKNK